MGMFTSKPISYILLWEKPCPQILPPLMYLLAHHLDLRDIWSESSASDNEVLTSRRETENANQNYQDSCGYYCGDLMVAQKGAESWVSEAPISHFLNSY